MYGIGSCGFDIVLRAQLAINGERTHLKNEPLLYFRHKHAPFFLLYTSTAYAWLVSNMIFITEFVNAHSPGLLKRSTRRISCSYETALGMEMEG